MMSVMRGIGSAALLLASALSAFAPAEAQELQAGKPIRMIVALAAGGGTDITARLVAQEMSKNMGVTVLVENKAGGNFIPAGRRALFRRWELPRRVECRCGGSARRGATRAE